MQLTPVAEQVRTKETRYHPYTIDSRNFTISNWINYLVQTRPRIVVQAKMELEVIYKTNYWSIIRNEINQDNQLPSP